MELPEANVEATSGPSSEQVQKIAAAAARVLEINEAEAKLAERLTILATERKALVEMTLPQAMIDAGLETWPLANGYAFNLTTLLNGSIPKDNPEPSFAFLEKNGHGDLIKRKFTIQFGRDDLAWAKKFYADCMKRKKPLNIEQKVWVEPQTLGAFVREQYKNAAAEGSNPEELVPTNLFGVFKLTYAKLTEPKAAKERKVTARR